MKSVVRSALIFLVPFAGWFLLTWYEVGKLRPKGATVAEHLATMPEPERFVTFSVRGADYLAVHGPPRSWWTFPSGSPMYIFDSAGRLVDWTGDGGDADEFHLRWLGADGGRALSREEADRWPKG